MEKFLAKINIITYILITHKGRFSFIDESLEDRLEAISNDLCDAFVDCVVTSNWPLILIRRSVSNFRDGGKNGVTYLTKEINGFEEMLNCINHITFYHFLSFFEEVSIITI